DLAKARCSVGVDRDRDGQIRLLEASLMASHHTAEFYKAESRLATEHALLDDNGDGLGTPADWFRGVRAEPIGRRPQPIAIVIKQRMLGRQTRLGLVKLRRMMRGHQGCLQKSNLAIAVSIDAYTTACLREV